MRSRISFATALAVGLATLTTLSCSQAAPQATPAAPPAKSTAEPTRAAAPSPTALPQPTPAPAPKVTYPEKGKTITMIVPWAAGGPTDTGSRLLAAGMEKELGIPVVVVNKAGASGQVGLTELAMAKPDGYTIGLHSNPVSIVVYMDPERKATYTRASFELIANHVMDCGSVAVKADSPYKTVKDLIDAARAKPANIRIGTAGIQTIGHLAGLMLAKEAGVEFGFVHFESAAPAITGMLGGNVDAVMETAGTFVSHVKSGNVRILGVLDKQESPFFPGVKTLESQGYKVYFAMSRGFAAPAGTPKEIINILAGTIKKVVESAEHKQRMLDAGIPVYYMDPEQYAAYWTETESQVKPLLQLTR